MAQQLQQRGVAAINSCFYIMEYGETNPGAVASLLTMIGDRNKLLGPS